VKLLTQTIDLKEDTIKNFNDIDEFEDNLYIEFQNIVQDLSQEITNNVMDSIVSTPLEEIYKKYEQHLPKIVSSAEKVHQVSEQMKETKKDLYENISKIITEVSTRTIEETIFTKLETIKQGYETQLPLIDQNSEELKNLIKEISNARKELYKNTKSIISEVSSEVLKNEVLSKFDELFKQHEIQLPKIKDTSDRMDQLVIEIEETRKKLYSNISNVYNAMSNKITDTVNEKLTAIYQKYGKRVDELDQKHKSLQEVNADLLRTKDELMETINNYKSEIITIKKDIEAQQKNSNNLAQDLKEKVELQNKLLIGVGIVAVISIFI
jgi:uncharacterized protein YdbL (DUF1318 family)